MNLWTRFALAFAVVAAVVASAVGLLSYDAAAERIGQEIDASLSSASRALADGQNDVLLTAPVTVGHGHRGEAHPLVAQIVAPDGAVTHLGGETVELPVDGTAAAIAAGAAASGTVDVTEVDIGHGTYRIMTSALSGDRGALQVAADVEQTHDVLHDMAMEIAWVSAVVLLVAAVAGWVLAGWITRRLMRLAGIAEDVSLHGGIDRQVPSRDGTRWPGCPRRSTRCSGRLATARDAQERLIQDAAHELRTPLTSLRTNASVLGRFADLGPDARKQLVADVQGETRELSRLVDELVELALAGALDTPDEPVDFAELVTAVAERVQRRTGREVSVDTDRCSSVSATAASPRWPPASCAAPPAMPSRSSPRAPARARASTRSPSCPSARWASMSVTSTPRRQIPTCCAGSASSSHSAARRPSLCPTASSCATGTPTNRPSAGSRASNGCASSATTSTAGVETLRDELLASARRRS